MQRFRFVSRLITAAGYRGWVVLLDEVELIGRYSLLQRAKSYAEVARWVRGDRDDPDAPIGAVLTTVDDFEAQVLVGKNDLELIPKRLRMKQTTEHELLAGLAETGMRVIERDQIRLQPPDRDELDRTYTKLKQIHAEAFGWDPPDVEGLERLPSNRMRQYVRAWINEWDLRRLDPSYLPDIAASEVVVDLSDDHADSDDSPSPAGLTRAGRGRRRGRDRRRGARSARSATRCGRAGRVSITAADVRRVVHRHPHRFQVDGGEPARWWSTADALPAPADARARRSANATAGLELYQLAARSARPRGAGAGRSGRGRGGHRHRQDDGRRGRRASPNSTRGGQVLVLVPTRELADQWTRSSPATVPATARIGRLGDGHRDDLGHHDIVVAVVNSARDADLRPRRPGGLLVADECHRYGTDANRVALHAPFPRRLGLSATYARADDAHLTWLDPYFGGTCYRIGYERAIRDGIIAPFTVTLRGVELTPVETGRLRRPHRPPVGGPGAAHRRRRSCRRSRPVPSSPPWPASPAASTARRPSPPAVPGRPPAASPVARRHHRQDRVRWTVAHTGPRASASGPSCSPRASPPPSTPPLGCASRGLPAAAIHSHLDAHRASRRPGPLRCRGAARGHRSAGARRRRRRPGRRPRRHPRRQPQPPPDDPTDGPRAAPQARRPDRPASSSSTPSGPSKTPRSARTRGSSTRSPPSPTAVQVFGPDHPPDLDVNGG